MKRRLFQILVTFGQNGYLLGYTNKAIYLGSLKEYCTPTLNCYACPGAIFACPIGTIQHFAIVGQAVPAYVMGYLAAIGAVVGRMCCGDLRFRYPDPVLAQKIVNFWAQQGYLDLQTKQKAGQLPPYIFFELIQLADLPKSPTYFRKNAFVLAGVTIGLVIGIMVMNLQIYKSGKGS